MATATRIPAVASNIRPAPSRVTAAGCRRRASTSANIASNSEPGIAASAIVRRPKISAPK
jgi:hypothetical protein